MTDRIHREDTELVEVPAHDELGVDTPEQATTATNAEAERAARAKREVEPLVGTTAAPREHTADPGDVEEAASATFGSPTSDDAADQIARWSEVGGPPPPRAADCVAETGWVADTYGGGSALRAGDDWLADHGHAPVTLADGESRWTTS